MKTQLSNGFNCLNNNCIKCCINTEMPLTTKDIEKIKKLGYNSLSFIQKKEKKYFLKNKQGKCYFLRNYQCSIYSNRPEGCRLYPLVYEENLESYILDLDCPYHKQFSIKNQDIEKLRKLIFKIYKIDIQNKKIDSW